MSISQSKMSRISEEKTIGTKKKEIKRVYPAKYLKKTKQTLKFKSPAAFEWGWNNLPLATRAMCIAVLLGVLGMTTPFWAYVQNEDVFATFGLWHFCVDSVCTSIHDNLVQGRDVPAWYHLVQGTFCIGVAGMLIVLCMLTTNAKNKKKLQMTDTVYTTSVCILGITIVQLCLSLYTFIIYFDETDFMYTYPEDVDFHGSFFVGIISAALAIVTLLILLIDDNVEIVEYVTLKRTNETFTLPREKLKKHRQKMVEGQLQASKPVYESPPNYYDGYFTEPEIGSGNYDDDLPPYSEEDPANDVYIYDEEFPYGRPRIYPGVFMNGNQVTSKTQLPSVVTEEPQSLNKYPNKVS